jgi:hypothetical protein
MLLTEQTGFVNTDFHFQSVFRNKQIKEIMHLMKENFLLGISRIKKKPVEDEETNSCRITNFIRNYKTLRSNKYLKDCCKNIGS